MKSNTQMNVFIGSGGGGHENWSQIACIRLYVSLCLQ